MKTILIVVFAFVIYDCYAQFEADVRLTNDPSESFKAYNNTKSIAATGNYVHVVWHDNRAQPLKEIFYKRSTDQGLTWEPDVRLTTFLSSRHFPTVAVFGSTVHVAWQDHRISGAKVFYKRSTDNGSTWGADVQLSHAGDPFSEFPSISVSGSIVHLVWDDDRDGNKEIYYARSSDAGLSWEPETRLTNSLFNSIRTSVSSSGSDVHVVWVDQRDGNMEIYYKNSADGGINWNADVRLTTDTMVSNYPSISSYGSNVVIVWQDNRNSGFDIFSKRSIDGGSTWGTDNQLTFALTNSFYPSVTIYGLNTHVVWSDVRDDNWEIYYKLSYDAGLNWKGDKRLTEFISDSFYPSIASTDSALHVVWQDNRDGNDEIYYKRDPSGNFVGVVNIGTEIPETFSLLQNYPNPFNPSTQLRFKIADAGYVKLVIYDNLGRETETLVNEQLNPGTYEVEWNGSNFASGIYYYKLFAGEFSDTKKMILVK